MDGCASANISAQGIELCRAHVLPVQVYRTVDLEVSAADPWCHPKPCHQTRASYYPTLNGASIRSN